MVIRVTRADRGDLALSFELGFNSVGAQLLFLEAKVYSIYRWDIRFWIFFLVAGLSAAGCLSIKSERVLQQLFFSMEHRRKNKNASI